MGSVEPTSVGVDLGSHAIVRATLIVIVLLLVYPCGWVKLVFSMQLI